MKQISKRSLTILFVFLIFCSAVVPDAGKAAGASAETRSITNEGSIITFENDQYTEIYSNGQSALKYRPDTASFLVEECATGKVLWNSAVTQDVYDLEMSSKTWRNYMQSAFTVTYAHRKDTRGNFIKAYSADEANEVQVHRLNKGMRITVNFKKIDIQVALEVLLENDGLSLRIPDDRIVEKGDYLLSSIELIPFFGAAPPEADGYLVYPDGCGAISYFNQTGNKHLYTQPLTLDIYGALDQEEIFADNTVSAMLPIYGIKNGERAFLAAITKGDTSARIVVNTSINTSAVLLNRANFEFVYRNQYRIYLSNLGTNNNPKSARLFGLKQDAKRISSDRNVRLFFLEGEKSDYNGMANVYRQYLIENKLLQKSKLSSKDALSLEIFFGASDSSTLFGRTVKATTFSQAQNIIQGYLDGGASNLQVTLQGWGKNGYGNTPESFRPDSAFGGAKGLKSLNELAGDPRLTVFLELDITSAQKGKGQFSTGLDVLQKKDSIPVTDEQEKSFILSPDKSVRQFQKAVSRLKSAPAYGFAVRLIGTSIYHDYKRRSVMQREQTADSWVKLIAESGRSMATEGGNLYALKAAQRLYNIPTKSSRSQISDEDIPWYQMIVYNSIPYSSMPGNFASDLKAEALNWIEYGCMPLFQLTEKSPVVLKNTDYNILFTSQNAKWKDRVLNIYSEFKNRLNAVTGHYMVRHERIDGELVRIGYDNGTEILINYGNQEKQWNKKTVSARNILVIKG